MSVVGTNGTYKRGNTADREMFCRTNHDMSVSCIDITGASLLFLDRETSRLGYAAIFGARSRDDVRDTVLTRIYNCTKF
jgi:hypothetical protein